MGERIKQARINAEISQDAFAKKINVTRNAISNYEKNNRRPDIALLVKIADTLNVSYDYLLGYSDTPTREYHDTRELTGLSDIAIKNLNDLVNESKSTIGLTEQAINKLKTINCLLEHEDNYHIFATITDFLFRTYDTFEIAGQEIVEILDKLGNINLFPVSDLYNANLLELERQLKELKDALKTENSSTTGRKKK